MMKERRHYSDELKAEAVKMVTRDGLTHAEVARRLGVPKGSIGNWIATFKEDTPAAWPGAPSMADLVGHGHVGTPAHHHHFDAGRGGLHRREIRGVDLVHGRKARSQRAEGRVELVAVACQRGNLVPPGDGLAHHLGAQTACGGNDQNLERGFGGFFHAEKVCLRGTGVKKTERRIDSGAAVPRW